jgi:prophage antirepressor-like protein
MNTIIDYMYEDAKVRVITDDAGEVWFVLRDVLDAMESATMLSAAKSSIEEGLGEEFVKMIPMYTSGGTQQTTIINEPAVTYLVARSNTETGKQINRWIHCEVLPSIRKTGQYVLENHVQVEKNTYDRIVKDAYCNRISTDILTLSIQEWLYYYPKDIHGAVQFAVNDTAGTTGRDFFNRKFDVKLLAGYTAIIDTVLMLGEVCTVTELAESLELSETETKFHLVSSGLIVPMCKNRLTKMGRTIGIVSGKNIIFSTKDVIKVLKEYALLKCSLYNKIKLRSGLKFA